MTDKDLIRKLKKLDKIHPSRQWVGLLRRNLVAQIDFELVRERRESNGLFWGLFGRVQPIALAISLIFILVGGPWLTLKASQPSLPGEWLYSVKKASEGIQTKISSGENKTRLQVEFASRRLEELAKISGDSFSPKEKAEKTKQVIIDFKGNLAGVSQYVKEISSKEEVVVVAKKTKKLIENLERTKEEAPIEIEGDIAEAEKSIEEINEEILAVLIGDAENEEVATSTEIIDEEILIFLETVTSTDEEIVE